MTGWPAHREVGRDLGAVAGATAEAYGEIGPVDAICVVDAGVREGDARLDPLGQRDAPRPPVRRAGPVRAVAKIGQREGAERRQVDVRERDRENEVRADPVPEVPAFLARPVSRQVRAKERLSREADRSRIQLAARIAEVDGRRDLAFLVGGLVHAARARTVEDREMIGQRLHVGRHDIG